MSSALDRPRSGIAALALILMAGNVLSRVLGLVREQLSASLFGTGDAIAAFTVADNLQTLLFDLMVSGALQAALVPVLAQWAAPDLASRAELRRLGGTLIALVTLILGVLATAGIVFAPAIVDGLTWFSGAGADRDDATVVLTIRLVRIVLPAAVFLGIGTLLQAMLFALDRVTAPALSTAVRNLAIVLAALLLSGALGVESLAWGTVAGAVAIVLVQIPPLARAGAMPVLSLHLRHPALREMALLYIPVFLGLLVSSAAVIVDRGLAWGAEEYALGAMRYATTLVQMVLGLVAAAIGLAALPTLSRHFAAADEEAFAATLGRALMLVTVLILPATFGLAALAAPVSSLLFGYGETGDAGARWIAIALLGYLPGTLAAAYDQVLIFAFYARRNTWLPVLVGVLAIVTYLTVALLSVEAFGMIGLVAANSAQFIVHAGVMWWFASRRFGWAADPRLNQLIPRCAMAALVMAFVALGTWWGLDHVLPGAAGSREIARRGLLVAFPIAIASPIYLALIWPLCGGEVRRLWTQRQARIAD
jgi:putative peptidoglycan lipid II flippase